MCRHAACHFSIARFSARASLVQAPAREPIAQFDPSNCAAYSETSSSYELQHNFALSSGVLRLHNSRGPFVQPCSNRCTNLRAQLCNRLS